MRLFSGRNRSKVEPVPAPPPAPKKRARNRERVDFDFVKADEIRKLLSSIAEPRDRAMVAAFAYLGVRCNELRMLNLDDVDWTEATVKVLHAKGGKQRLLPAAPHLLALLRAYLAERPVFSDEIGDALFVGVQRGRKVPYTRISNRHIRTLVKRYGKEAGVGKRIGQGLHPHALRHSFGTALHREGVDLGTIQRLMGHSSPSTSMLYVSIDAETKRGAVRRLKFEEDGE